MKKITWIKLYLDLIHNPKISFLRELKDGNSFVLIWTQLLLIAGESNRDGLLMINDESAYSAAHLAKVLIWPLPVMKQALIEFEKLDMIERQEGVINITNWEKYQSTKKMAKIREDNALAQKRKRLKAKIAKAS